MKIFTELKQLNSELERQKDKRVVFSNGVFDILHPGHIELLEFAKSQGEILILGINDDDSVKRLKGEGRPIFPVRQRMEVLAAIQFVDYIIPFCQDTPLQLIQGLNRIDVLVKGGDYQPHQVVGKKEVEGRGGILRIFKFKSPYSTTSLIKSLKQTD